MKVNIYYGGRGLLDDPTLYVLNKMEEVLQELRVTVERINIYEHKNEIATLPQTMKDAEDVYKRQCKYCAFANFHRRCCSIYPKISTNTYFNGRSDTDRVNYRGSRSIFKSACDGRI